MAGELINRLSPYMVQPNRSSALNVESKILAALRFFASGSYQLNIAEDRNISISQSSVSRSVHEVIDAVHESHFLHDMELAMKLLIRNFSTAIVMHAKVIPSNLKGKTKSSQEWLTRQLSDPYVEKAKMLNFRCRSAFKLLQIDDKHKILKPGFVVVDCGCAPGSWTQVAVKRTNSDGSNLKLPEGKVVGIDLQQIHHIPGATLVGGSDFTLSSTKDKIKSLLDGKLINCVLSDMAPNATGIRVLDQENIIDLCYNVVRFAILLSTKGASLLVKVWDNGDVSKLEKDMKTFYETVKRIKPDASRSDSAELFLLARGFRGIEK